MKIRTVYLRNIAFAILFGVALSSAFGGTVLAQDGGDDVLKKAMSPVAAAPTAAPVLAPPGAAPAATAPAATTDGSALPDGGAVQARSPGMQLPVEAGLPPGPTGSVAAPADKSEEQIQADIREDSFNAAITGLLPLEPPEIRKLLKRYDETKEATEIPVYPYPEPENVVKNISLDPGVRPIELKLAVGNVTTVSLLDVTGAPWPIGSMTWAGNFEIVQSESGGHIFRITPMSDFAYGNISISLVELKTPITFVLKTHRDGVYYRVDARLPEFGPLARPPIMDGGVTLAAGGNPSATAVLDGVPPEDVEKMDVSGVDGRTTAYKCTCSEKVYVRTPLTLLSPAWSGSIKSADGMNVYTIENAPVILLSDRGRMVRARLSERTEKKDD